jgi:hypothetical protein
MAGEILGRLDFGGQAEGPLGAAAGRNCSEPTYPRWTEIQGECNDGVRVAPTARSEVRTSEGDGVWPSGA